MNNLFGALAKKVESFNKNAAKEAVKATIPARNIMIRMNKDQLLVYGIDSEGRPTRNSRGSTQYRPRTIRQKKIEGQTYSHITLNDSGAFYDSFDINFKPTTIRFEAYDIKKNDQGGLDSLFAIHGKNVMGLTKENLEIIKKDYTQPNMVLALRNKIKR